MSKRIDALWAMLGQASPLPWEWHVYNFGTYGEMRRQTRYLNAPQGPRKVLLRHEEIYSPGDASGLMREGDAALLVAAANALPALLDVVDAARRALPVISDMTRVVRMGAGLSGEAATVMVLREALAKLDDES